MLAPKAERGDAECPPFPPAPDAISSSTSPPARSTGTSADDGHDHEKQGGLPEPRRQSGMGTGAGAFETQMTMTMDMRLASAGSLEL